MLTVSLHGIRIVAPIGLYPEEKINPNTFEADVDIWAATEQGKEWPFIDYAIIHTIVKEAFTPDVELLETLVQKIHAAIQQQFTATEKIKVCIRKLQPASLHDTAYSQVCWEQ
ncbi:MAG: dihydroneopterin aldolase [Bacteroidetes bacterium]|nr:dihydroneopterin aldolase [Bacteroidota bacterium]